MSRIQQITITIHRTESRYKWKYVYQLSFTKNEVVYTWCELNGIEHLEV